LGNSLPYLQPEFISAAKRGKIIRRENISCILTGDILQSSVFILLSIFIMSFTNPLYAQSFSQAKPWMGIVIETKINDGVQIKDTVPETPAAKAGLMAEDIVKKIDGVPMTDAKQLISYIQAKGVGNEVIIDITRAGKDLKIALKLEAKPDDLELIRKSVVGKKIPAFTLDLIENPGSLTAKDLSNKVAVIEFWATWCPACRDSHARLSKFAADRPGIVVLAVSDEEVPELKAYAEKVKPKFTIVRDGSKDFSKQFMVSAIPMTVVVDKTGTITFATLGAGVYLEEAIAHALSLENKK